MSSDVANVYIGASPNDGTGDPIRTAFNTVNNNFNNIDTRISTGNVAQIYATIGVTGEYLKSNSYTTTETLTVHQTANIAGNTQIANLTVNNSFSTSTLTSSGNVDVGSYLNVAEEGNFAKNVTIQGNLSVLGNVVAISTADTIIKDAIINLHSPADLSPLTITSAGVDIGLKFHYYDTADRHGFLGRTADTGFLEFYASGNEVANVFTGTNYGTIKAGEFLAANTTPSTNATTGALRVAGGAGISGALNVGGTLGVTGETTLSDLTTTNLTVTNRVVGSMYFTGADTIYVNGAPVATAAASFTGGNVANFTLFQSNVEIDGNLVANVILANNAIISGNLSVGAINNTPIGSTTPSSGAFTSLSVASSFAANNVTFIGGSITNISGNATTWSVTNLSSGNAVITGGSLSGLSSVSTTLLSTGNAQISGGAIAGVTTLNASGGSLSGMTSLTTVTLNSTNGLSVTGTGARITGDFTNATIANRTLFQTSTSNSGTNIGAIPRGSVSTGNLTSAFVMEDSTSVTGIGAIGSIALYQDSDIRITSGIRGSGTYLPLTFFAGGGEAMRVDINKNVGIGITPGGSYKLEINGNVSATGFVGSGVGLTNVTASTATTSTYVTGLTAANVQAVIGSVSAASFPTLNQNTTGSAAFATTANTVTDSAQPAITSVGTLTGLTISGNLITTTVSNSGSIVYTATTHQFVGNITVNGSPLPSLELLQNRESNNYTLVLTDSGKHILHPSTDTTSRTFTIPSNASVAFPIGTAVTFINQRSAGTITIAINSDSLYLAGVTVLGGAGVSRTLAPNCVATAVKIDTTEWIIYGNGLT